MQSLTISYNPDVAFGNYEIVNVRSGKVIDYFDTEWEAEDRLEELLNEDWK